MMTSNIVSALTTPFIAGLENAWPNCTPARARPALGKTNYGKGISRDHSEICKSSTLTAHQLSVKDMCRIPLITATVLMQKNQNANMTMNVPANIPINLTVSPSGNPLVLKASAGNTSGARRPKEINPAAVYPAGPTETYIPGLVEGLGSALVMSRCMYMLYIIKATVHDKPCNITAPTHISNACPGG